MPIAKGNPRLEHLANVGSQALNTVGSLLWVTFAARVSAVDEFGFWALLLALATALLQVCRTGIATLVLVHEEEDGLRTVEEGVVSLIAVSSLVSAVLMAVLGGPIDSSAVAFSVALPLWMTHDALRQVFIRHGHGRVNLLTDATWVAVLAALCVAGEMLDHRSIVLVTLARAAGALIAMGIGWGVWGGNASPRRAVAFALENVTSLRALVTDGALGAATAAVLPLVVAAVIGLNASAALRGANTLMGGMALAVMAFTPIATVAMSRVPPRLSGPQFLGLWSMGMAAVAGVYGLIVLLLPEGLGRALLGESWTAARSVALPFVLQALLRGPLTGVPILLKSQGAFTTGLRLRVVMSVSGILVPVVGAIIWGLPGAAWGIALAALVNCAESLVTWRRHSAQNPHRSTLPKAAPSPTTSRRNP